MKDNFDFYKTVVYQTLPTANYIWTPAVPGAKRNVVLAREANSTTYVFKFNGKESALRNSNVARALRNADIPAPEIIAQSCGNQWFEVYPAINGQTLYECVGDGISHTELKSIYSQLLKLIEKMSHIDFLDINFYNLKYSHQTACADTTKVNGPILGHLISAPIRMMNIGASSNCGLYHYGMTPKNIMISNRGEVSGILDIDEAGICNKHYALGVLFAKAKLIGMDIPALCDEYERISGQRINRKRISMIIGLQNFGRSVLYKTKSK